MTSSTQASRVIGIDVAKDKIDVSDDAGKIKKQINHTTAAIIKHIVKKIDAPHETFVVCEATGGYEQTLVDALHRAGISVNCWRRRKKRWNRRSKRLCNRPPKPMRRSPSSSPFRASPRGTTP